MSDSKQCTWCKKVQNDQEEVCPNCNRRSFTKPYLIRTQFAGECEVCGEDAYFDDYMFSTVGLYGDDGTGNWGFLYIPIECHSCVYGPHESNSKSI